MNATRKRDASCECGRRVFASVVSDAPEFERGRAELMQPSGAVRDLIKHADNVLVGDRIGVVRQDFESRLRAVFHFQSAPPTIGCNGRPAFAMLLRLTRMRRGPMRTASMRP